MDEATPDPTPAPAPPLLVRALFWMFGWVPERWERWSVSAADGLGARARDLAGRLALLVLLLVAVAAGSRVIGGGWPRGQALLAALLVIALVSVATARRPRAGDTSPGALVARVLASVLAAAAGIVVTGNAVRNELPTRCHDLPESSEKAIEDRLVQRGQLAVPGVTREDGYLYVDGVVSDGPGNVPGDISQLFVVRNGTVFAGRPGMLEYLKEDTRVAPPAALDNRRAKEAAARCSFEVRQRGGD